MILVGGRGGQALHRLLGAMAARSSRKRMRLSAGQPDTFSRLVQPPYSGREESCNRSSTPTQLPLNARVTASY
jgi:hypothetical protein